LTANLLDVYAIVPNAKPPFNELPGPLKGNPAEFLDFPPGM
jgi:hypothetical protein